MLHQCQQAFVRGLLCRGVQGVVERPEHIRCDRREQGGVILIAALQPVEQGLHDGLGPAWQLACGLAQDPALAPRRFRRRTQQRNRQVGRAGVAGRVAADAVQCILQRFRQRRLHEQQ